jgi:hypothetical protein
VAAVACHRVSRAEPESTGCRVTGYYPVIQPPLRPQGYSSSPAPVARRRAGARRGHSVAPRLAVSAHRPGKSRWHHDAPSPGRLPVRLSPPASAPPPGHYCAAPQATSARQATVARRAGRGPWPGPGPTEGNLKRPKLRCHLARSCQPQWAAIHRGPGDGRRLPVPPAGVAPRAGRSGSVGRVGVPRRRPRPGPSSPCRGPQWALPSPPGGPPLATFKSRGWRH